MPLVREWERRWERSYFAASPGRSASDAVWESSLRSEGAVSEGFCVAARLWDLRKCYEHVRHFRLAHAAARVSFPLQIARVAVAMYRAPRLVSLEGATAPAITPLMGIIAGCTNAMALLKACMVRELDAFARRRPLVILDMYVDDGAQVEVLFC